MLQGVRVKRIRVGDDIMAYCGRCKAERTHVVAAMNSDTVPADVICRTCHGKHRFRRQPDASEKSGATGSQRVRRESKSTRSSNVETAPSSGVKSYSPREAYSEGEWVEHRQYGTGKVTAVRGGKIDVKFDTGLRTLIHSI